MKQHTHLFRSLQSQKISAISAEHKPTLGFPGDSEGKESTCNVGNLGSILWLGPGWMHETSAWTWCTGKTQRDRMEREVGGRIGMGNTCTSKADSCQCMTKTTTIL